MRVMLRLVVVLVLMFLSVILHAEEKWRKVVDLRGSWKFSIGDNRKWADPRYNDNDWESLRVPGKWEDQGFNGFDGYAWYRKTFAGSQLGDANSTYHLLLGYIDDADEVYLNGHLIGSSGSFPPRYHTAFNALRRYVIPNEHINFNGPNVISVRVYDAEIEGGIVGGDVGVFVNDSDRAFAINLRGMWDFTLDQRRTWGGRNDQFGYDAKRTPPEKASWKKVMVPSLWEHLGYPEYDGTAWYKKQFFVPKSLEGEDLVLILGKIDDFDQTYLNGKLIGSTAKHDHLRVYYLNADAVNAGAWNILLVYVDDYTGFGGIYEGPIGFMKQSEFTRYMRWKN
jgi:hypothetical protein